LGIPTYVQENPYNVFIHAFWLSSGASDIAEVFSNPLTFFSTQNPFGNTT